MILTCLNPYDKYHTKKGSSGSGGRVSCLASARLLVQSLNQRQ